MPPESMSERMAAAARELEDQQDPSATVKSAVDLLVRNVTACGSASISLLYAKRRVETPAASDEVAATGDRLQAELGEGPALSTLWEHESVYVPDLLHEDRWPTWGRRLAEEMGVRSVATFRLFTLKGVIGASSMYSVRPDAFTEDDLAEARALAAHMAIALLAARRNEQFHQALDSRTVIGQACGIVMERFGVDDAQAFALLTRLSSTSNTKLKDVAAELVRTRVLPASAGWSTADRVDAAQPDTASEPGFGASV